MFQKAPFENAQIDEKNVQGEFVELAKIPPSSRTKTKQNVHLAFC